jgi:predicted nucleic acid-binding protein
MTEAWARPPSVALDTNLLVYAEGEGDAPRCAAARALLGRLEPAAVLVPVQVLGELHRVLTGRFRREPAAVREALLAWADAFHTADSSWTALQSALDLHADHQLPTWDALILSVAAEQGCRVLLSEDFQPGFTWRGLTVVNPFASLHGDPPHPLLQHALRPQPAP